MTEQVKCMICGKVVNAREALDHKEETGHDKWELLIPKEKKETIIPSRMMGEKDIIGELPGGQTFNLTPDWLKEYEEENL